MSRVAGFVVGLLIGAFSVSAFAAANPWPGSFAGLTFQSAVTGGGVSVEGPFSVWPAVNDGSGGAKFQGSQRIVMPKASATATLSRAVTAANLARYARLAVGASMPIALLGLAYEGVSWVADHWETEEQRTLYTVTGNYPSYTEAEGLAAYQAVKGFAGYLHAGTWHVDANLTMCKASNPGNDCWFWSGNPATTTTEGVPATDAQVDAALQAALVADPTKAAPLLANASDFVPVAEAVPGALVVTGPATVNGGTSTSTKVDTSGTTTTNNTTTYNLSYTGGAVNITETVTSVVTFPDNSTSTTTTSTAGGDGTGQPPVDPVDVCAENPNASGCAEFGEHDPEPDLGEESRSLSWVPGMSAAGSCPAPQAFTVHGQAFEMDWVYVCDLATGIRPVVLAVAWLSAAVFVFGVGRGTVT